LMVRSNKQYQLTPKGQRLLQQLNPLMPQLENLWQAQELSLDQIEQVVTIAGSDMDIVFISKKLHKIQQLAPNLRFAIRNSTPRVLDDLVNGEVDFALTAFEDDLSGIYRRQVASESFVVIAGKDSLYCHKSLDLDAYMQAKHGKFAFAEPTRGIIDSALEQQGLRRDVRLLLPTFLQIPAFLADPDLLFSVPENFAKYLANQFEIKILPLPFNTIPLPIYLYWHERLHSSPLHKWLREQLLEFPGK
ncbi:MAG: LysR substrate-binding domain-containing protein, partial [Kangiellaceae bacterium]|nr:LysR substrate-binding domain-containing protein [Kangiellaceae bacterium]